MFRKITLLGVMLAFIVVVMGASLRLSGTEVLSIENGLLKDFLTDRHFYTSAGLTVVVFLIGILAWYEQECRKTALITAFSLLGLVVAQGYLGLWSVSEHSPALITGHSLLSMGGSRCSGGSSAPGERSPGCHSSGRYIRQRRQTTGKAA